MGSVALLSHFVFVKCKNQEFKIFDWFSGCNRQFYTFNFYTLKSSTVNQHYLYMQEMYDLAQRLKSIILEFYFFTTQFKTISKQYIAFKAKIATSLNCPFLEFSPIERFLID